MTNKKKKVYILESEKKTYYLSHVFDVALMKPERPCGKKTQIQVLKLVCSFNALK